MVQRTGTQSQAGQQRRTG